MVIKKIFEIEKKPRKGLLAVEWVIMAYLAFTLLLMLITYTKLQNPEAMLSCAVCCYNTGRMGRLPFSAL